MFYKSYYSFLKPLKDHWLYIRNEYELLKHSPTLWHEGIHNGGWYVIGLKFQGQDLPEKDKAPVTSALCDAIPGIQTYGFSIMKPGCEIHPHHGYTDEVYRAHLGLYTNPHSGLQVEDYVHIWRNGELFMFDDTKLHSAWNRGGTDRVILLIDFLKP